MKIPSQEQLPFPLSSLFEKIQQEDRNNGTASIFSLLEISFATSRFLAFLALAEYFEVDIEKAENISKQNRYIFTSLQKPGDGTWISLLEYLINHIQIEKAYTREISNVVSEKSEGNQSPLQILKSHVVLRNNLIHRNEYVHEGEVLLKLKSEIDSLGKVWELLSSYRLYTKTSEDKTIQLQGIFPFPAVETTISETGIWLESSHGKMLLSPWLYFDETINEVYFYAKKQADRFYFMSYLKGGQVSADKFSSHVSSTCTKKMLDLEKNASPTHINTQKEIALDFSYLCDFHSSNFVGRTDILESIKSFISSSSGAYGVVIGEAGMGKTALLASVYEKNKSEPVENQYLWHFCAHTEERDNPQVFFRSLLAQGYKKFPVLQKDIPFEIKALSFQWQQFLQQASEITEKLVFVIDALDESLQIENPQESICYLLPKKLPSNVVAILTIRKDMLPEIPTDTLKNLSYLAELKKLEKKDIEKLLVDKLQINENAISTVIMDKIWKNSQQGDPFYLRFMADALRSGSLSLQNINLIPDSLESFFEETWLTVPIDDDFLAHQILGLLAIMQEAGEDAKFADIFGKAEGHITRIRIQLNKLLVMKQDSYTIFHQKFRDYIVNKFANRDIAIFHRLLCEYYDVKDDKGKRASAFFSEEACRHICYHAHQKGLHDTDYTLLYQLVDDDTLRTHKKQKLKATQFILDDILYAIKSLAKEAFTNENKFVLLAKYSWLFNSIINDGRKAIPQAIANHITAKKYDLALVEIQLIADEKQQFYQLMILAIAAMIHKEKENVHTIFEQLETLPVPSLAEDNISIFILFAMECIDNDYLRFYELLPQDTNLLFWQAVIQRISKVEDAIALIDYLHCQQNVSEQWLFALLKELDIKIEINSPWYKCFYQYIKNPCSLAKLLLNSSSSDELLEEVITFVPDVTSTQEKAEIISLILTKNNTREKSVVKKVMYYIEEIDDVSVKTQLATEFLFHGCAVDEEMMQGLQLLAEKSNSSLKRFPLEVSLLAHNHKANLEEFWLAMDGKIKELGSKKDSKEVRKLIDLAKAITFIKNDDTIKNAATEDVKEELAQAIMTETYQIHDESLRNEVMLEIAMAFAVAERYTIAVEICEQLLYVSKAIFPWTNRCAHLSKILEIMKLLNKESLCATLKNVCTTFPNHFQTKIYTDILPKIPFDQSKLLVDMFFDNPENIHTESFLAICRYLQKNNSDESQRLLASVSSISKNTLQAQCLLHLASYSHGMGKDTAIECMLKSQQLLLNSKGKYLYPYTLYRSSQVSPNSNDKVQEYFRNHLAENTSWESFLFTSMLEKDYQTASHNYNVSLSNILDIPEHNQKFYAMRNWIQAQYPVVDFSFIKSSLSVLEEAIINTDDSYQQFTLIAEFAKNIRTLEKVKEAKQLFHFLVKIVEQSFSDPIYFCRSLGKVMQSIQNNPEFTEEMQVNIDKIWQKAKEHRDDYLVLTAILRSLRSYGNSKKIKEYLEPVINHIESEKDITIKAKILKDALRTLTGIETISRLQRVVGKLLQTISQITDDREKHNRLVELSGIFYKLEEYSHMETVWDYLSRISSIIEEIESPYTRARTQIGVAQKIHKYKPEEADIFLAKALENISLITNSYQKSSILSQIALFYQEKQEYQKCLSTIEKIPVDDTKMLSLLQNFSHMPHEWQLETIPLAIHNENTLDQLFAHILKQEYYSKDMIDKIIEIISHSAV